MKNFIKRYKEVILVNLLALGFIGFTLLVQFGVHIKVHPSVDLIPTETQSVQSSRHSRTGSFYTYELYVRLIYKEKPNEYFWLPSVSVFGRASDDEVKEIVKEGNTIKRNVFINTKSHEVIGVTKSGKSVLSLYYYNSKMFRYGLQMLILSDILLALIIEAPWIKEKV